MKFWRIGIRTRARRRSHDRPVLACARLPSERCRDADPNFSIECGGLREGCGHSGDAELKRMMTGLLQKLNADGKNALLVNPIEALGCPAAESGRPCQCSDRLIYSRAT